MEHMWSRRPGYSSATWRLDGRRTAEGQPWNSWRSTDGRPPKGSRGTVGILETAGAGGRVYEAYDGAIVQWLVSTKRTTALSTVARGFEAHDGAWNSDGGRAGTVAATTARRLSRTAVEWTNEVGHDELPVDGEVKFTPLLIECLEL